MCKWNLNGYRRKKRRTLLCQTFLKMSNLNFLNPILLVLLLSTVTLPCVHSSYYNGDSSSEELIGGRGHRANLSAPTTLAVLNLATRADIFVNATCGEKEPETYCKLVEHVHLARARTSQCQVCDDQAGKRHPIKYAIDGSNRWWQSPSLQNGRQYEWVTITIDLKQVYQVTYIIIKAAISPRPGNWILERSLDGIVYMPWQYYAISDEECLNRYKVRAKRKPIQYTDDEEVICTSYYSELNPLEGGEIHTSLVHGRPGASGPSERLTKFTMARYVRLRLQKIRTLHGDLIGPERSLDKSVMRRYFYSIKDISIGGHCVCFGHASECIMDPNIQREKCLCQHNTCGDRCDVCCPLFNQYPWGAGNASAVLVCEPCNCHGHADACIFDPLIASQKLSMNAFGVMEGGGVCLDCKAHTTGVNCDKCENNYFRPLGVARNDPRPCVKCQCDENGSDGTCVADEDVGNMLGKVPGDCFCKVGYGGKFCDKCDVGYKGYPNCQKCPCFLPGIVNTDCEGDTCVCKENVEGKQCERCKDGFYNLDKTNPEGCTQCFCHGITDKCTSSNFAITRIMDTENWFVTDLHGTKVIALSPSSGMYHIANEEFGSFSMYYWGNAKAFSGNRILSYGLQLTFYVSWVYARGDTSGRPIQEYDLIIQSTNNMLAFSNKFHEGSNATIHVTLNEQYCFVIPDVDNNIIQRSPTPTIGTPCTRLDVMEGIHDVKRLLIRAKYHTDQIEGVLGYAFMEKADTNFIAGPGEIAATSIELCSCPNGYKNTSCQECGFGYRKSNEESWINSCVKCDCNGHSETCDSNGKCMKCQHNTSGDKCQNCKIGFYGSTSSESPFDCKPCECPLSIPSNNFSPTCQMSGNSYVCTACPNKGYTGEFCERCASGFYGNPTQPGDYCKPCDCNLIGDNSSTETNICDHLTGECLICPRNTIGWNCDECLKNHYKNGNGSCSPCNCDENGSDSDVCDLDTGKCSCFPNVRGKKCDTCTPGYWNIKCGTGCIPCDCNPLGSLSESCDIENGQCLCKPGVGGLKCDRCIDSPCTIPGHICDPLSNRCVCPPNTEGERCSVCVVGCWGDPSHGCKACNCSQQGSTTPQCSPETGKCSCVNGFEGDKCNRCKFGYFNYPHCTPCSCDPQGTDDRFCNNEGICSCADQSGQCHCKDNVVGKTCSSCREGTYGLEKDNPEGCMECFCFQRTHKCSEGLNFKWQRLALPTDGRIVPSTHSENELQIVNNLIVIPGQANDILIQKDMVFSAPLYWQLPHIFLGDKVLSYNGFLRFKTDSAGRGSTIFPSRLLGSYPLVQIQRLPNLILEYYPTKHDPLGYHEVRLHEDEWRLKHGPYGGIVSKETMMVALQNLNLILIRGTHSPEVSNASLYNVSLDIAIPSPNGDNKSMAHGVEICQCPPEYNSTSCQNPRIGFYRWYKRDYITSTVIIDLVGEARPCECNGRANTCDTETGFCQNCTENTGGRYCDKCAVGFYGEPFHGGCFPCPCPTISNNHAESCYHTPTSETKCFCKKGYKGELCQNCDSGWYYENDKCRLCECSEHGSVSQECDNFGNCKCKPGVKGSKCNQCADRKIIVGKTCTGCDQCTSTLLDDLLEMNNDIKDIQIDQKAVSAIRHLIKMDNISKSLEDKIQNRLITKTFLDDIPIHETLAGMMFARAEETGERCGDSFINTHATKRRSQEIENRILLIKTEISKCIIQIDDYIKEKGEDQDTSKFELELEMIVNNLNKTSDVIEEISDMAEDELDAVNELFDLLMEKVHNSGPVSKLQNSIINIREKLEDLMQYISQTDKNSDEAARIIITAREFLDTGTVNVDTIDEMIIDMDMKSVMTTTANGEGRYAKTELEQVFMMLEDIITDFRNNTKELEILETGLFELVPLYRTTFAQPAFDHVKGLEQQTKYLERLLIHANSSASVEAVTAYERIKEGFDKAFQLANDAKEFAQNATEKVEDLLSKYSGELLLKYSSDMIQEGLTLSGIVENSIQNNATNCKSEVDSLKWRLKVANDGLQNMNVKLEELNESLYLDELLARIYEISDTVTEVGMDAMEIEGKIQRELQSRIDLVVDGSPIDAIDTNTQVRTIEFKLDQVKSETTKAERRQQEFDVQTDSLEDRMKYLKALIKQARHKTNTVGVSIGPDESGTCFRLFKWPIIESTTSIKFNFAPTRYSDSLLFYWPSSINIDFISIEMVSGQIKASWDLGSGLRTLIHPRKLSEVTENSINPDFWVQINLERVGSFVTLDVRPVSMSDNSIIVVPLSSSTAIMYHNNDEEMTLMNHDIGDLIHIGAMSKLMRDGLVSNGLSGCIHNLQVNHQSIGLWNFVGNEGCAPCFECPDVELEPSSGDLEYYFDGRGYSTVDRVQSKTFNSKFFDVSLEFRTLSENGLIFLTMNDRVGQMISLEIINSKIVLQVSHTWNNNATSLRIESESSEVYNNGEWVNVRAVWVFQKGMQIGKLMIGKKDFSQDKKSTTPMSLVSLMNSSYHIGGVSPIFDPVKWKDLLSIVPYVGCMKSILINNSPYDPLSGNYYGVETPCGGKASYLTSFEGDGYAEFASQSMGKNFKFGFSFKTLSPTGLLVLSTGAGPSNTVDDNFYAVYLENGQIRMEIQVEATQVELMPNGTRYDDGKFHDLRFVKKNRKIILYMDDEEIAESRFPKQISTIQIVAKRGLFLGGTTEEFQRRFNNGPIMRGFFGCIQNFYFNNELVSFNFPISHRNQNLRQCPKHHNFDPSSIPTHFLYPNTIDSEINRYDIASRVVEESCSVHEHVIEQEDPVRSLHFGDSPNSYVTLNLEGNKYLRQRFNLTFSFRTHYPNGLFFQGLRKKGQNGQCLMAYLKDGQITVKLFGERPQDLISSAVNLNDGTFHQISIVKAEDKMYLYVDNKNANQIQVPKIKAISKLNIGGFPQFGHNCLENSISKPEPFKGCMKNFVINSHSINFETRQASLQNVNPCFKNIERGSFFKAGSYAIYTYNLTLGNIVELALDFKSDSKNGLIISFVPNKISRHPTFSIFLEDGQVIARESTSNEKIYEAVVKFEDGSSACDGKWHTLRANYEKGSITLRIDNQEPIFALEPLTDTSMTSFSNGNDVVGTLYVGGIEEDASRLTKRRQFHGCIRNISVNRQIKDWTDFSLLSQIYLNSCPA